MTAYALERAAGRARRAWLVGNVYEGVVDVPRLLANARRRRRGSPLRAGSPARFFLPLAPLAVGGSMLELIQAARDGAPPLRVVGAATSLAGAVAISAYLIRRVNLPLLGSERLAPARARGLVARWHRLNAVRVALLLATDLVAPRARSPHPMGRK